MAKQLIWIFFDNFCNLQTSFSQKSLRLHTEILHTKWKFQAVQLQLLSLNLILVLRFETNKLLTFFCQNQLLNFQKMLFKFGLNLINLHLQYQSRLGINLLKYDSKLGKFAKLSYSKFATYPCWNWIFNSCHWILHFGNKTSYKGGGD